MPSQVQLFGPDDKNTTIWSPGSEQNPDGCANVYSSLFVEGYFYKVCPTGFSSNQLYLSLPAGFVSSTISQEDATQAARALLAAKGEELAEASGTCTLGEFQEIFSYVDSTYNWDWVADKATTFPITVKNVIPDGTSHGTGSDSGVIVEFPIGNSLSYPLMIAFFYSAPTMFLMDTSSDIVPSEALRMDIHDDYGLLHLDLASFQFDTHPNLNVYAGKDSNDTYAINTSQNYAYQNTVTYMGKLVADFGGREIHGPAWDADVDGPGDNPFDPNPNAIPEFTVAALGGFLFRIDTTARTVTNGKLAGVYLVCYKEDIQVYKYNAGLDDYESLYTIPFNPKNKTTYFGASIIFDGVNKVAEIYIDGQFELSIPDDTLTNIHLPICYLRGVFSMDHWVGDITTGTLYPGTNRLPPPITTVYFEPAEMTRVTAESPFEPGKLVLKAADIVGADTELEANAPFPKLAAGSVESGFNLELLSYEDTIGASWGGTFFGAACNILTRFDPFAHPQIGAIMWGAHALKVGKIEFNRYTAVTETPDNPYKYLPTNYGIHPVIPVADLDGIDWANYDLFGDFLESYQQPVRWSCSWLSIFQPSEAFPDAGEGPSAEPSGVVSEFAEDVIEAGLFSTPYVQTRDGWLYTTNMINLFPPYASAPVKTKTDVANHAYFFDQGWFGTQTFLDIFSSIRTIKLMTGVQGKRTSEVLTGPEYNFNFTCPLPPTEPDPININIPCPNQEFVIIGTFGAIEGGTHWPLVVESYKDCLFGDPYDDVCYPGRKTWFNGFGMVPSLQVVFNAGQGIQVQFDPQPNELVYIGARILQKLHIEFIELDVEVTREDWPGLIYSGSVFINLRTDVNDPAASDLAYSTLQEACYFVPSGAIARYEENVPGDSLMIDQVIIGARYKFVFTLPGGGIV